MPPLMKRPSKHRDSDKQAFANRSGDASESRSAWNAVSKFKDFILSDAGALARYQQRRRRRVHITIDNIEPQSKKMPNADRDTFQAAVAEQLTFAKRGTFRGDVALKLDLATTQKNAPQAHTIAKNLLDLLSQRRPGVEWPQRHLLYKDDRQSKRCPCLAVTAKTIPTSASRQDRFRQCSTILSLRPRQSAPPR
jgi:hypothetical protein